MTTKTPRAPLPATPFARKQENPRQITSAHIAEHLAAFEASGGHVQVLGTTPVLKRLSLTPAAADVESGG